MINPAGTENDRVIGQWDANGIGAVDAGRRCGWFMGSHQQMRINRGAV